MLVGGGGGKAVRYSAAKGDPEQDRELEMGTFGEYLLKSRIVMDKHAPFYVRWVRKYMTDGHPAGRLIACSPCLTGHSAPGSVDSNLITRQSYRHRALQRFDV